jgi:DNA-binding winged helix-turn-helix (wHTH) protein
MAGSEPVNNIGGLVVDTDAKFVMCGGALVHLTATEYRILTLLARHPGWVFSPDEIVYAVWGYHHQYSSSISVHIAHIRQKLSAACPGDYVETVRGLGYRLRFEPPEHNGSTIAASLDPALRSVSPEHDRFFGLLTSLLDGSHTRAALLALITGVQGIGKTWSLNEAEQMAIRHGWLPLSFDCRLTSQRDGGTLDFVASTLHARGLAETSWTQGKDDDPLAIPDGPAVCHRYHQVIASVVAQHPLLLMFDDADHMDDRSASVLSHIATECRQGSLGIIVAAQDSRWRLRRVFSEHSAAHFELRPLSQSAVQELAREQGIDWLSGEQLGLVAKVTSGVPGRLVDLSGELRHACPDDVLSEEHLATLALTLRMRSSLSARLEEMSPPRVELMRWIVASGNDLDVRLLNQLAGASPAEVWRHLQDAIDSGDVAISPDSERVLIPDPLLVRFLRDRMPPGERIRRERSCAQPVEECAADAGMPPEYECSADTTASVTTRATKKADS